MSTSTARRLPRNLALLEAAGLPTDLSVIVETGSTGGRVAASYASTFPQAAVYSFDPDARSFAFAKRATADLPNVRLLKQRLSDEQWPPGALGAEAVSLAGFCEGEGIGRIDLLRITAQADPLRVIAGGRAILPGIGLIEVEVAMNRCHPHLPSFIDMMAHMAEAGFYLFHIGKQFADRAMPSLRLIAVTFIGASFCGMAVAAPAVASAGVPAAPTPRLDLMTVAFRGDLELLRLQARSFARLMDPRLPASYIVIWNDSSPVADIQAMLAREWPAMVGRTRVVARESFIAADLVKAKGWRLQQALKLAAMQLCTERFVCVLDAKNHAIRPIGADFFFTPDGRAKTVSGNYTADVTFGRFLRTALRYLDATATPEQIANGLPTTTPNLLLREAVLELMAHVSDREQTRFDRAFIASPEFRDITEFMLYYAWFLKSGRRLEDHYAFTDANYVTFFRSTANHEDRIRMRLLRLRDQRIGMLGLHRAYLGRIGPAEEEVFATLWLQSRVFAHRAEVTQFLAQFTSPTLAPVPVETEQAAEA